MNIGLIKFYKFEKHSRIIPIPKDKMSVSARKPTYKPILKLFEWWNEVRMY